MARGYSKVWIGYRIIVLLLLLLALVLGGAIWFDYIGFMNFKDVLRPFYKVLKIETSDKIDDIQKPSLLDEERIKKQLEAIELIEESLNKRENELKLKESEIAQIMESIDEQKKALEEKENSFNVRARMYENKKANLEQNSKYLVGMPPLQAVKILEEMADQDIIDVLRTTERLANESGEASMVSYWLSKMDSKRAAVIQRKMAKKPVQ